MEEENLQRSIFRGKGGPSFIYFEISGFLAQLKEIKT
jgi:hypothetical protein